MSRLSCRYIERHLGEIVQDSLSTPERIRVELHLGECEKCRKAVQTWRGFEDFVKTTEIPPLPPLVERHVVIAALDGREPVGPSERSARRIMAPALVGASILATAAAVIIALAPPTTSEQAPPTPVQISQSQEPTPSARPPSLREDQTEPLVTPSLISDNIDDRMLIEVGPGVRLWVRKESVLTTKAITAKTARFFLEQGHVLAEVTTDIPGYRFIVETPNGEVEAKGTVFSVESRPDGEEIARVLEGTVEVRKRGESFKEVAHYLLRANQQGTVGSDHGEPVQAEGRLADRCLLNGCREVERSPSKQDEPQPSRPVAKAAPQQGSLETATARDDRQAKLVSLAPPTEAREKIDALTSLALEQRKRGQYLTAAATYEEIIALEGSNSSSNALVSLGQLELIELRRYRLAVSHFERYLKQKPTGYLAEEARLGRVQAFAAQRNQKGIITAADDYLKHHEGGYAASEVLLMRADAKRKAGDCQGAVSDYRLMLTLWPASRQQIRVETGLRLCNERP